MNRLIGAGVPYGLAALIAEANYPGGEYAGIVDSVAKARARDLTQGFLEHGTYSLEQAARGIFGSDYGEAVAFSEEVEATAGVVGKVRRGEADPQSQSSGHLPGRPSAPQPEPSLPPEGWYDDPDDPEGSWRWWNGHAWTDHRSPK